MSIIPDEQLGRLDILNVADGDTKLVFDENDPEELARGKEIIEDMLRRGYTILVEVKKRNGQPGLRRVKRFNPKRGTYIIGDKSDDTEREVPVKRARATAVGRTAGG